MNFNYFFRIVFIAVALLFLGGVSVYASETDERIESSARDSYVFKNYLKDDSIQVQSKDGVVTLTGTVYEDDHKILAEETVTSLPGVQRIDNQINVKNEKPIQGSDAWVSAKVKAALLFHRNVSGTRTKVDVKDGIVTLSGEAYSQAEKDLATEYAKDVEGIKGVKNEMTVVLAPTPKESNETMSEKIDDASITAQVKVALLFNHSTSALRTKVDTDHGVVTVQGKARNPAEKDLVTKLVSDIHGVKNVVNEIVVE